MPKPEWCSSRILITPGTIPDRCRPTRFEEKPMLSAFLFVRMHGCALQHGVEQGWTQEFDTYHVPLFIGLCVDFGHERGAPSQSPIDLDIGSAMGVLHRDLYSWSRRMIHGETDPSVRNIANLADHESNASGLHEQHAIGLVYERIAFMFALFVKFHAALLLGCKRIIQRQGLIGRPPNTFNVRPLHLAVLLLTCVVVSAHAGDIFLLESEGSSLILSNIPEGQGYAVLVAEPVSEPAAANAPLVKADGAALSHKLSESARDRARRYAPMVSEVARDNKMDAGLLHAVAAAESAYNPAARSSKGAMGIMQLMPATAARYGVTDPYDAKQNLTGGARYLSDLMRMFNNDTRLALAAYNAGENAVLRYGGKVPPFRETEAYVPKVLDYYRSLTVVPL